MARFCFLSASDVPLLNTFACFGAESWVPAGWHPFIHGHPSLSTGEAVRAEHMLTCYTSQLDRGGRYHPSPPVPMRSSSGFENRGLNRRKGEIGRKRGMEKLANPHAIQGQSKGGYATRSASHSILLPKERLLRKVYPWLVNWLQLLSPCFLPSMYVTSGSRPWVTSSLGLIQKEDDNLLLLCLTSLAKVAGNERIQSFLGHM